MSRFQEYGFAPLTMQSASGSEPAKLPVQPGKTRFYVGPTEVWAELCNQDTVMAK